MDNITRFLPIDEEGYWIFDGLRVEQPEIGGLLLRNIQRIEKDRFTTEMDGQKAWVEAFDAPFVVRHIERQGDLWKIHLPYGLEMPFELKSLSLDEWDRFHGLTSEHIPFVFSRHAQMEFFNALDGYDDSHIESHGKQIEVPPWLSANMDTRKDQFWTNIYQTETPGWEMNSPNPALVDVLPQIRLPRSRVLILGCGSGHDAAHFAEQGHLVTAVDFSPEALERAKAQHKNSNISWLQADAFELPEKLHGQFDVIFEHTFYCAIDPDRRNDLVKAWRKYLAPKGHLLGIFFVMDKLLGPPWGGSEWELRQRFKGKFQLLYWTRWRKSAPGRQSKELVIYAQKT